MDAWEKLNAAQRMQDYIHQHLTENNWHAQTINKIAGNGLDRSLQF